MWNSKKITNLLKCPLSINTRHFQHTEGSSGCILRALYEGSLTALVGSRQQPPRVAGLIITSSAGYFYNSDVWMPRPLAGSGCCCIVHRWNNEQPLLIRINCLWKYANFPTNSLPIWCEIDSNSGRQFRHSTGWWRDYQLGAAAPQHHHQIQQLSLCSNPIFTSVSVSV